MNLCHATVSFLIWIENVVPNYNERLKTQMIMFFKVLLTLGKKK